MSSAIYRKTIAVVDKFVPGALRPLWNHEAGPKTIFFWAPLFKWSLVIAGLGDLNRPAEKLSIPQSAALSATGLVWSRYSMVIIPKNWSLFSVNVFVALTNLYSLGRGIKYMIGVRGSEVIDNVPVPVQARYQQSLSKENESKVSKAA